MKKYGVVKVKNPSTNGHSVKLLPCQSFQIIFNKSDPSDFCELSLKSDFLQLGSVVMESSGVVYEVEQKYDLTDWCEISTTFLGNLIVKRSVAGVCREFIICVYCSSPNSGVLTVINPDDALVKLDSRQLLHVVNFDKSSAWSMDNPANLECLRCETVLSDFKNVYDREALFCPEPRSIAPPTNQLATASDAPKRGWGVVTEYHFWTCPSSNFDSDTLRFYGGGEVRVLNVVSDSRSAVDPTRVETLRNQSKVWDERFFSYTKKCLLNPMINENIDASASDCWFYLEIPSPKVYFPATSDGVRWLSGGEPPLECQELGSRHVNGILVQRFFISNIQSCKPDYMNRLSSLVFLAGEKRLRVNLWRASPSSGPVRREKMNPMTEKVFVNLELVEDGKFADDEFFTPLDEIPRHLAGEDGIRALVTLMNSRRTF